MIARAEPLPIGSRVCKTPNWEAVSSSYCGTTTSEVYHHKNGYYVDVCFDARPHRAEPVHLCRLRKLREE